MRLQRFLFVLILCAGTAASQNAAFPLESVTVEGSSIPQSVVLEIAGLHLATPIDKTGIEQACAKLQETGVFASIAYRYAPGPKQGYAVTLTLVDQAHFVAATIDVPGADEDEAWQWLSGRFGRFDHQAPQGDAAQQFLAKEIERHIGSRMRGQHLTIRMETDLRTRKLTVSFQPPAGSASHAHASVSINSLGLIDNLQMAASGLQPGTRYKLVLVGNGRSEDLAEFNAGIGGTAIVQTLGPLKRVAGASQGGSSMRLEVRLNEDSSGGLVLGQVGGAPKARSQE